jgi:uncharacterized membrane protein
MPTPDDPNRFKTPDPALTSEALVAYAASAIAALIVLFKLHISDAQQGAMLTLIGIALAVGIPLAGAITRKGRAMGNAQK